MIRKIVPNIFALTQEDFEKKLRLLDFAKEIHLDFMDGEFTHDPSLSLDRMKKIIGVDKFFSLHMMARMPLFYLDRFLELGVRKVYIHYEVYCCDSKIISDLQKLKESGIQAGLVVNPLTPVSSFRGVFENVDSLMLMSVEPGKQGQKFLENTYDKIKEVRNFGYLGEIAVDGGISDKNAFKLFGSGANVLYVGSYINESKDAKKRYDELKKLALN